MKKIALALCALAGTAALTWAVWPADQAPPVTVRCDTTAGALAITVVPQWSPLGSARLLELVRSGHFNNVTFYRCVSGFVCQFGRRSGTDAAPTSFADDPPNAAGLFKRGYVSFAGFGPNSRSGELFIALADGIGSLGAQPWETPVGYIAPDSPALSQLHTGYGDIPPWGQGPDPARISATDGEAYLAGTYPQLTRIRSCSVI
ncbi:peptidylprolyl isomerase [Chitinibacteraceae bacterium HSL-7]